MPKGTEAKYYGTELPVCDYPHASDRPSAAYDGKTTSGPWAYMCEACFRTHGVGLGTGKGQRLTLVQP